MHFSLPNTTRPMYIQQLTEVIPQGHFNIKSVTEETNKNSSDLLRSKNYSISCLWNGKIRVMKVALFAYMLP
jgi:hypothetical protein